MFKDLNIDKEENFPGVFPVANVEARVVKKVIEWCVEHKVIEQAPNTRERKWFTFSEHEKKFFDVPVEELDELSIAALIKGKSPDEIRALFGLEDDLTEEEKNESRKQNPWCNY
ncbi:Protein SKR-2 [Aphelenchoides avenae]|nr:Protein SKR-2 [Aphelenchus avenae]